MLAENSKLDRRIIILALGRFLSMIGSGFTSFYAPVFFVEVVHISATLVGIGLAANSIAGTLARVLGGTMSDSPNFGRRITLVIATIVLLIGSVVMGLVQDFNMFLIGNTLLGIGIGFYWPSSEAMISDLTNDHNRRDAFALNRFADYFGLGIGVVLAGLFIQATGAYRTLFFIDGFSYGVLTLVILFAIKESSHHEASPSLMKSWGEALRNPLLQIYVGANFLMTSYIIQISSSLPLYLTEKASIIPGQKLNPFNLSMLFAVHVAIVAASQIPLSRLMNKLSAANSMIISCIIWFVGFILLAICGLVGYGQFLIAIAALAVMSLASVAYGPASSALVVELAPPESRAIYLSVNSLCWAMGGMLAPPAVLAAMDYFPQHTPYIWLVVALSTFIPAAAFGLLAKKSSDKLNAT